MDVVNRRPAKPRAVRFEQLNPTNDGVLVFLGEVFVPVTKLIGVLDLPHWH
jgi:hypothetical protein